MAFPKTVLYSEFKERNPEYRADFWKRCRALYKGGPDLLENEDVLKSVMPQHNAEEDHVYKERLKRAFYIPYAGSIIDKIIAELMGKPLTVESAESEGATVVAGERTPGVDPTLDPFYEEFFDDCSRVGGKSLSVNQLIREQALTSLQCGTAWTLVDLPKAPEGGYANRAEQDAANGRKAYAAPVDPECVIDWEEDDTGELILAITQEIIARRDKLGASRNLVTIRIRVYTREEWAIYEFTYDKKKKPTGPSDKDEFNLKESGTHTFKRVPLLRLQLPSGLWAMGKLEAMARAHLNQRNALSWGQLKALFPVPILYAQPPNPIDPVSEDSNRGQQRMGPGQLWVLAEKDRMEYFSPDTAPYDVAGKDLDAIRDEMYRVLHHMAMSVDNSGAALQRSADSKAIDQAAASAILRALGMLLREHTEEIYETVAIGRGEPDVEFHVDGMDSFDDVTLSQLVLDAVSIESVQIPSATFQKKFKLKIAKLALGADAAPEDIEAISDELDEGITQDAFAMAPALEVASAEAEMKQHERTVKGEPDPAQMEMLKAKTKAPPKKAKKK